MTIKKVFQIISLGLLLYLLADSLLHIEFAATKNNYFTTTQKEEIALTQNIDSVKQRAKDYLDTIRRVHRKYSSKSVINFWILVGLVIIQTSLFLNNKPESSIENNGR